MFTAWSSVNVRRASMQRTAGCYERHGRVELPARAELGLRAVRIDQEGADQLERGASLDKASAGVVGLPKTTARAAERKGRLGVKLLHELRGAEYES